MASSWVDLSTLHNPTSNVAPPATWGDQIRENEQHLYERIERVIARTVLGVAGSSISSGTLPTVTNGWKLRIIFRVQHASTTANIWLRFNGDSSANYYRSQVSATDTAISGDTEAAATQFNVGNFGVDAANRWSAGDLEVHEYLGTSHKTILGRSFYPGNLSTTALLGSYGLLWANTAAITTVSLIASTGNFAAGSSLTVLATPVPV